MARRTLRLASVLLAMFFVVGEAAARPSTEEGSPNARLMRWLDLSFTEHRDGKASVPDFFAIPVSADGGQSRVSARMGPHSYTITARIDPGARAAPTIELSVSRVSVDGDPSRELSLTVRAVLVAGMETSLLKRHHGGALVTHLTAVLR